MHPSPRFIVPLGISWDGVLPMQNIQRARQHWRQSRQMDFPRKGPLFCGLLTERRQKIEIHTDTLTPKVEELRENNKAALHVWIRKSMLQLRLEVCFDILRGLDVVDRWNAVPSASRISYGTHPIPGQPITGPFDYEKPAEQALCRTERPCSADRNFIPWNQTSTRPL